MAFDAYKPDSERERTPAPEELKLADNQPVINLFLPDKAVVSHNEHEEASDKLRRLASRRPSEFALLEGMSLDAAQAVANNLLGEIDEEDRKNETRQAA